MDTLRRPGIRPPSIGIRDAIADVFMVAGFALMVLGIYEVGGLFNLGLGLLTFWVGASTAFAEMGRSVRG